MPSGDTTPRRMNHVLLIEALLAHHVYVGLERPSGALPPDALRILQLTVPRVGRSDELFSDGFNFYHLHLRRDALNDDGQIDGQTDIQSDGQSNGQTDGERDGQTDGHARQTTLTLLSKFCTNKTVTINFWPWLSGKNLQTLSCCPLFARNRVAEERAAQRLISCSKRKHHFGSCIVETRKSRRSCISSPLWTP